MKKPIAFLFLFLLMPAVSRAAPTVCTASLPGDYLYLSRQRSVEAKHTNDFRQKSRFAIEGITFADQCLGKDPNQAGCLYFRAVNRGLELETRTVRVKKELKKMMDDFLAVIRLDPSYDNGGAYLALGYVYLKTPSFPVFGKTLYRDLHLAQAYASQALEVAPEDPFNLKLAGEIAYKKGEDAEALIFFKRAQKFTRSIQDESDQMEFKKEIKKWVKKARKRSRS